MVYVTVILFPLLQTIIFLEQLLEFADTAGAMLLTQGVYCRLEYRLHICLKVLTRLLHKVSPSSPPVKIEKQVLLSNLYMCNFPCDTFVDIVY